MKQSYRKLTIICICTYIIICNIYAGIANNKNIPMSPEKILAECDVARDKSQYTRLNELASQLLTYAKANDSQRYEAYALFYKGLSELFTGKGKESMNNLNKSENIAKEIDNDSIVALALNAKGIYHAMYESNLFLAQRYFLRSLEATNKMDYQELRARVYGNLIILSHSKNDSTGLQNAKDIYEYGVKNKKYELQYLGTYYIAMYNHLKGNQDEAAKQLDTAISIFNKYPYEDISSVYTLYSQVEQQRNNLNKAESMAMKAIALAEEYKLNILLSDAKLQYATVLNAKGEYMHSNEMAFEALKVAETQNRTKVVDCYQLIAKNYNSMGQKDDALNFLSRANMVMDTLSTVNMDRLMHERAIMHDIEQKEQEAILHKQRIEDQHRLNIVLIVAVVLMLILLFYILRLYNRRNSLYKSIVMQNAKATKREKEMQKRLLRTQEQLEMREEQLEQATKHSENLIETLNNVRKESKEREQEAMARQHAIEQAHNQAKQQLELLEQKLKPHIEDDKAQEIYDRLCQLMERDRIYTDTQLNREHVAELLNTNRTYLSQIIKNKSGMSYLQFVNSYRINDAIRILSDRSQINYPLKQICSDLGFNSPVTFYKLFQQAVGITPSVYRKQFVELKEE